MQPSPSLGPPWLSESASPAFLPCGMQAVLDAGDVVVLGGIVAACVVVAGGGAECVAGGGAECVVVAGGGDAVVVGGGVLAGAALALALATAWCAW